MSDERPDEVAPCPRCDRGVTKEPNGRYFRFAFCDCAEGVAASQRPCTCPTLADLAPGAVEMLDAIVATMPALTAEESAIYEQAAAWREAWMRERPACPLCAGNCTVKR
jgi:hypothetical protein